MKNKNIEIIINQLFPEFNQTVVGREGGGLRMNEILMSLQNKFVVNIHSTEYIKKMYINYGLDNCHYIITPTKLKFHNMLDVNLINLYLILKSFLTNKYKYLDNKDKTYVIYSTSDLFWETIPAFIIKLKQPQVRWVQLVHHIYPNWINRSGNKIVNFLGYYIQRLSHILISLKADIVITINQNNIDELVKRGIAKNKIELSYNGLDIEYINKIKIEKSTPSYDGVFIGRLNYTKGVFDLIKIWKKVVQKNKKNILAIIGTGPKEIDDQIKREIVKNKMSKNIQMLGYVKEKEKIQILKNSKLFVFPSHEEGWGIAISEAIACHLTAVVYDLENYHSIYKDSIFYIKKHNHKLFAQQINILLKNNPLRKKTAIIGYNLISKYDWKEICKLELELIKKSL